LKPLREEAPVERTGAVESEFVRAKRRNAKLRILRQALYEPTVQARDPIELTFVDILQESSTRDTLSNTGSIEPPTGTDWVSTAKDFDVLPSRLPYRIDYLLLIPNRPKLLAIDLSICLLLRPIDILILNRLIELPIDLY
jgi:hypothetical protein